ncbi:uncharacterized protein PHALS_01457 [Plasmopara halstedii]|uniref:Uncharacterized protein n=1 Tax=Plasmopara halstedii TaxID=4781 RepID=A0A0P1AVB8_PLAHL|nr:uncharacterized protein PHALS_01457 [Plasmopara halstedii]CEG45138.1 hypothetical protein PHALS_01457 [Plasmopara halstedii]|eukprot:XP_024581507.1 hypothetical protein PHALS_01457 [Plasmopara halstedii]
MRNILSNHNRFVILMSGLSVVGALQLLFVAVAASVLVVCSDLVSLLSVAEPLNYPKAVCIFKARGKWVTEIQQA